jgi:hypothetical protein
MLGAELTVSHHTFSSSLGYGHTLLVSSGHALFISLLVIIFTGGVSLCILSSWLSPFVSCEISYWLRLIMALWLKLTVSRRNRGPSVCAHTWLRYLARAGITVSSCNPLWDYINVLSWHNLVLTCEIHYWYCSVMVSWLRTHGAAAKLRASCECAHRIVLLVGCWYQGLWSWSIVELHWCVIFRGLLPWNNFSVVCQMIKQHLSSLLDKKSIPLSCVVSFLLILVMTTHTSSLYIFCVKVKPWSFLVWENN